MKRLAALALAVTCSSPIAAFAGPLEDAAMALAEGSWVEIPTQDIVNALTDTGGSSGNIFGYADELKWDSVTRRLIYIGMDHGQLEGERFVAYQDDDNSWAVLPTESWMAWSGTPSHGYDHHAIDTARRFFYFRYPFGGRSVYRHDLDSGAWNELPENDVLDYAQCCGALEYFPELDGIVWVQAGESSTQNGGTAGGVFLYTEGASGWTRLGDIGAYEMGIYQNFAEYLPTRGVLVFGGGNDAGTEKLYKLDATGTITPLADAPISLGVHQNVHVADPVSGELLVLTDDEHFFTYDVDTDTWGELPAPTVDVFTPSYQNSIHGVVGAPVETYAVMAYVSCDIEDCGLFLYRHKEGIGVPPPSGPTGSGGNASTPAASGAGGGSQSAANGAVGAGGSAADPAGGEAGGCGCRMASRPPALGALGALIALVFAARRRRETAS